MRTLRQLPVPQVGDDVKWPDGQIRNETVTETGTPVVRELYGDIVINIYKILRDAGIVPTETEDGEHTQYQLVQALKVFTNELNDLQQILTVAGTNITSTLSFSNLPDNYVFIGKVSEDIISTVAYTINDSGANSYPVNIPSDIPASSIVIAVLNSGGSTIVGLNSLVSSDASLNTAFGTPIAFNDSSNLLYYSKGNILTDFPKSYNVENKIQVAESSVDIKIVDTVLLKNRLICLTFDEVALKYQAFAFDASDLDVLLGEITMPDFAGVDNQPYMYADAGFLYFTNSQALVNESVNNYDIGKFNFDEVGLNITAVSFFSLNNLFEKTTNLFVGTNGLFYTLISGQFYSYDPSGSAGTFIGNFNTINGVIFRFNSKTYYSNGNVATEWNY